MASNPYGWASPSNSGSLGNANTPVMDVQRQQDELRRQQQQMQTSRDQQMQRMQASGQQPSGRYNTTYMQNPTGMATMASTGDRPRDGTTPMPPSGDRIRDQGGTPNPSYNYNPIGLEDFYSTLPGRVPGRGGYEEDFWRNTKNAGAYQAYSQNQLQPLMNFYLQQEGLNQQGSYNQASLNEQIRLNTLQHGLATAGSEREERALAAQLGFNERDFLEAKRQFNATQGLSEQELALQRQLGTGRLDLDQMIANQQYMLGSGRLDLEGELGRERLNLDRTMGLGELGLQGELGRGDLALRRELGFGELGLGRNRLDLEGELGRGRLGLDRSRLGLDERALAQEAELMREQLANQMQQARMAAYGRSQQPSFRAMNSWR